MAQQVLGLAGAIVGGMIGGPLGSAAIGSALGSAIGGYVGMGIDTAGIVNHGPRLDDRRVQSSANGIAITRGFGTIKVVGNIVQSRDIEEVAKKQKAGKGNQASTVTYSYYWTGIIVVHDGQVAAFRKVFANKKLVGDKSEGNTGGPGDIFNYLRFYDGSNDQQIDPISLSDYGESAVAYNNRACIVADRLPLADFFNQVPTFEFEIIITEDDVNITQTTVIQEDYSQPNNLTFERFFYDTDAPYFYAMKTLENKGGGNFGYKFYKYDAKTYERESISQEVTLQTIQRQDINYSNISKTSDGFAIFYGGLVGRKIDFYNTEAINIGSIDIWNSNKDEDKILRNLFPQFRKSFAVGDRNHFLAMTREFSTNNENTFIVGSFGKSGDFTYQKRTLNNSVVWGTDYDLGTFSNGLHFFITSSTNNQIKYLSTSEQENLVLLNDYVETNYRFNVHDMFFDEATKKIFLCWSKDGATQIYLSKIDLITKKRDDVQLYRTAKTISFCLNFDSVNRLFFFYERDNQNGSANYVHVKLDSLEIRRFDANSTQLKNHTSAKYQPAFYNSLAQSYFYNGSRNDPGLNRAGIIVYNGNRAKDGFMKLSKVIQSLIKDTSLTNNDIDVSELEDIIVKGYKITNSNQISAVIEQLAQIYAFEIVDSPHKLRFIKSKREIAAVIEEDDLGARFKTNDAFSLLLDETITQDIELPRTLTISYMDKDKDYEINTQECKRVIDTTQQSVNYQFPIVLNSDEAIQLADRMMYTAWTQKRTYAFDVSSKVGVLLEPGDVVKVNANSTSYIIKITEILSNQGIYKIKGVSYDNSVYVQNGKGNTGLVDNQVLEVIAGTNIYFLDIPIFAESDNNFGIYVTVDKSSKGKWRGAGVYEIENLSTPDDAAFIESFAARTTAGTANTSKLRKFDGNMIDYLSSFVVTLNDEDDELESCSYEDLVQKDLNICVVGGEIIQFMNAEYITAKTYKISMLLRNRLSHSIEHLETEKFVLMDFSNGSLKRFDKELKILNTTKSYKAITSKAYTAPIVSAVNTGVGQKPLQVCDVMSGKNGNGDMLLKFTKRVRGQLPLTDNVEGVDIDGDFYEIDIFKGDSLVRTVALTETNFNYSNSMQIEDNTTNQSYEFRIYKINKNFGRGFEYVHKIL